MVDNITSRVSQKLLFDVAGLERDILNATTRAIDGWEEESARMKKEIAAKDELLRRCVKALCELCPIDKPELCGSCKWARFRKEAEAGDDHDAGADGNAGP